VVICSTLPPLLYIRARTRKGNYDASKLNQSVTIGWFTVSQLGCNLKRNLGLNLSKLEAKFEPSWCANAKSCSGARFAAELELEVPFLGCIGRPGLVPCVNRSNFFKFK